MICTALISHLTVLIFLHLVASCYEQWDKLPLEGPLGTRADFYMEKKICKFLGKKHPVDLDKLFFFLHD